MAITLNGTTGITTPDLTSVADIEANGSAVLTSASTIATSAMPAGSIIQVQGSIKIDTATIAVTSTANTPVTGVSVDITPRSTASKILITVRVCGEFSNVNVYDFVWGVNQTIGGVTTQPNVAEAAGNRARGIAGNFLGIPNDAGSTMDSITFTTLVSPNTVDNITYQPFFISGVNSGTYYLNRTVSDADLINYERASSEIIVQEIAG